MKRVIVLILLVGLLCGCGVTEKNTMDPPERIRQPVPTSDVTVSVTTI